MEIIENVPARALDRPASELQWIVFQLGGCEMAVRIQDLKEIIRMTDMTRVPKAPPMLCGVINLRGRVLPVLDLKRKFQMPLLDPTEESRILVVESGDQTAGFLVDRVQEVVRVAEAACEKATAPVLEIGLEFIGSTLKLGKRLILLLDFKPLFKFHDPAALLGKDRSLGD